MKGRLVKIYGQRDPTKEAQRDSRLLTEMRSAKFPAEAAVLEWYYRMNRIERSGLVSKLEAIFGKP